MPDANAVAASHDIVQMLFYFVCALGCAIAISAATVFRFILLPLKDGALNYFKHQGTFMDALSMVLTDMKQGDELRFKMHEQNLQKLSDIYRVTSDSNEKITDVSKVAEEIKNKIRCPVEFYGPLKGTPGHVL